MGYINLSDERTRRSRTPSVITVTPRRFIVDPSLFVSPLGKHTLAPLSGYV